MKGLGLSRPLVGRATFSQGALSLPARAGHKRRGLLVAALVLVGVGCGGPRAPASPMRARNEVASAAGAGGFPGEVRCWGGLGREAGRFVKPRAIAAGGDRLYVVDMSGRIQVFDLEGHWQATWVLPDVSRGYPTGLGVRTDGCLAVADTHNFVVRLYNPEGVLLRSIGREGGEPGEFTYVRDVAFDAGGNMYVSEHGREDRIQKFNPDGRFLLTWGRSGEGPGEFRRPEGLAIDEDGSVYVADAVNHRIQKFSPEGTRLAIWGGPGKGPGELLYPYGLTVGPGGILLVAEYGNNRVQAFDGEGRSLAVWGGPGRGPGEFSQPWGIEWVKGRGLYVADAGNHRVQWFRAEGLARLASRTQRSVASGGCSEPPVSE